MQSYYIALFHYCVADILNTKSVSPTSISFINGSNPTLGCSGLQSKVFDLGLPLNVAFLVELLFTFIVLLFIFSSVFLSLEFGVEFLVPF